MWETKLAQVRKLVAAGRDLEALRIVAKFPSLGDEKEAITRGWNAACRPDFYGELGFDPNRLVAAGVAAMKSKYRFPEVTDG